MEAPRVRSASMDAMDGRRYHGFAAPFQTSLLFFLFIWFALWMEAAKDERRWADLAENFIDDDWRTSGDVMS